MAHSKRNTSLPHFTSYERSLLRSNWGTQRTRLSRESFLPFGSCQLCLQPARAPVVACAHNGDLFCRECAINDLLAQRKEIKRLEREREESARRSAEDEARMMEEARVRELKEFELISMGLEGSRQGNNNKKRKAPTMEKENGKEALTTEAKIDAATEAFRQREIEVNGKRRKVFELSEAEIARYANSELERLRKKIELEKVYPPPPLSPHDIYDPMLIHGTGRSEIRTTIILDPVRNAGDRERSSLEKESEIIAYMSRINERDKT